jgi:hypothetical protein
LVDWFGFYFEKNPPWDHAIALSDFITFDTRWKKSTHKIKKVRSQTRVKLNSSYYLIIIDLDDEENDNRFKFQIK